MILKELVRKWFEVWDTGAFYDIPVADNFKHTSPYGTIEGKQAYLKLVESNKDKFLGNNFEIHDELYEKGKACVRYTVSKGDFSLKVSEWYFLEGDKIVEIISYYNIEGEISEERKLAEPE